MFKYNCPEVHVDVRNILEKIPEILKATQNRLDGGSLDVVFATLPHQNTLKNGG